MNYGKFVFAQLTEFLPKRIFDGIVLKYEADKGVRHFSCWNQMLCLVFGHLSSRESLRDLILIISAHSSKSYHLGLGKNVTRSNFAKANEKRSYKVFEEFSIHLIAMARKKLQNNDFEIEGKIYAFDSTTIDLCLSVFWWAKFRKTKAGIKVHTLLEITTQIPVFIHITEALVNDVNAMDEIPYEKDAYYIFDRAYVDFARLYKIHSLDAFFVVRAKINLKFKRIYSLKSDRKNGLIYDQIGKLEGFYSKKDYPEKIRRVKYFDQKTGKIFVFLTNNFEISALQVAMLYKNRWKIELFFKWMKQHLKIKTFWGTSENAVRIQIYTAIITYCLVAIVGKDLKIRHSIYEILQILGISLLDKTTVRELLTNVDYKNTEESNPNLLMDRLF